VEQRRGFHCGGVVGSGYRADHLVFLDGERLGKVYLQRLGARPESGEYALPGITAEWLEDDEATEEAFPA
jgi:hypothetical protein